MSLYVSLDDDNFRFYKELHEDVQLKPNTNNKWDIQFHNGDWVNVTGHESLKNAICIAIMTRYTELTQLPLYTGFGCRIHELIKDNVTSMHLYKMEIFIEEVLKKMRRIHRVNEITITEYPEEPFKRLISFTVTSINDELVEGSIIL